MRLTVSLLTFGALVIGCANEAPEGPPTVKYGQAECAECGMIVSNERYSAAIVLAPGERDRERIFDDINCMVEHDTSKQVPDSARRYVHDAATLTWVPASDAVFVKNPDVHTPMGSGLQAFAASTTTMPASSMTYQQLRAAARAVDPWATGK